MATTIKLAAISALAIASTTAAPMERRQAGCAYAGNFCGSSSTALTPCCQTGYSCQSWYGNNAYFVCQPTPSSTVPRTTTAAPTTTVTRLPTTSAAVTTTTRAPTTSTTTKPPVTTTATTTGSSTPTSTGWPCESDPPKNQTLFDRIMDQYRTIPGTAENPPKIDLTNPANNPANVQRVMRILSPAKYDYIFPIRNPIYTYEGLLQAIAKWPAFCDDARDPTKKDETCTMELISAIAHFVQETGKNDDYYAKDTGIARWRQGLYEVREAGGSPAAAYRDNCDSAVWGKWLNCPANTTYYGRGVMQLSYPFNYAPFSEAVYNDTHYLINKPDLIATSPFLAFASGIWFSMTPQSPKPSMHDVLSGWYVPGDVEKALNITPGFGATIQIINSECGLGTEKNAAQNRINTFVAVAAYLNFTSYNPDWLTCANMQKFPADGIAAIPMYYSAGAWNTCKCAAVTYQTPFWMLSKQQGYKACVCDLYPEKCV